MQKHESDVSQQAASFLELLKRIAEASLVLGAVLYSAGWSYLYGYYSAFGVSIGELNIGTPETVMFSFKVLFHGRLPILIVGIILLVEGAVWFSRWFRNLLSAPGATPIVLVALLVLAFFLSRRGSEIGRVAAESDMLASSPTLPQVSLLLDSDDPQFSYLNRLEFKLLAHANNSYYMFRPIGESDSAAAGRPSSMLIYIIPESHVREVRIIRGTGGLQK